MENEKHEIQMRANEEQRTRNGEREVTNEEREIGRTNLANEKQDWQFLENGTGESAPVYTSGPP